MKVNLFFVVLVISLGAPLIVGPHAFAQDMNAALAHFQQGEAQEALDAFEALRTRGGNEPATMARIYRHLGILHATFGEDERSAEAFARSLAIEPEQQVPSEIAEEAQAVFRTLRRSRAGRSMEFVVRRESPNQFLATIEGAPDGLISRVEVEAAGETTHAEGRSIVFSPLEVIWLSDYALVRVRAFDEAGNVLVSAHARIGRAPTSEPTSQAGVVWGVILGAVALIAGGVIVGLVLSQDPDSFEQPMIVWP